MKEYRGAEHVLIISDGLEIEVLHPEGCPHQEVMEGVNILFCDVGAHLYEWGTDLFLETVKDQPGMYLIQFWATPPGWAGPVPIDADAGMEINRLSIDDTWPVP